MTPEAKKRILVADDSRAVQETLRVILERDFNVDQSPSLPAEGGVSAELKADLLILGAPPEFKNPSSLLKIASQVSCPVLFLLDSESAFNPHGGLEKVDFLAKPFNPYELREKVERLLNNFDPLSRSHSRSSIGRDRAIRYVDFPYLSLSTSALAKRLGLASLPILILGEAGSGQEQVARALYCLKEMPGSWVAAYAPEINRELLLERIRGLSRGQQGATPRFTLFLCNLDALGLSGQSSLLEFLQEQEASEQPLWVLSNSRADLLERVYRGEFLDALYYRLATLTLWLPPLRERRQDIPALATRLAEEYGERLNLGRVSLSAEAAERLCDYLWPGNLKELEIVIARTLAIHRKGLIEASDLVLGAADDSPPLCSPIVKEKAVVGNGAAKEVPAVSPPKEKKAPVYSGLGNGDSADMTVLIHELAHELKNPMVAIKTFAQLLGEQFGDKDFRASFQERVNGEIERMNELLEAILDFSRFTQPPLRERVLPNEQLRQVVEEMIPECGKKGATVRWIRKGEDREILANGSLLRCAFKNVFRAVLDEAKAGEEIQIDVEDNGNVTITYVREPGRTGSLTQYLDPLPSQKKGETLPLRLILAKILMGRSRGRIEINHLDGEKVLIRAEVPDPFPDSKK